MSIQVRVSSAQEALRLFDSARSGGDAAEALNCEPYLTSTSYDAGDDNGWSSIDEFSIGKWACSSIEIKNDFKAELNGPFLEAYLKINRELLRLYAFAKYGNDDNRNLSQEDLEYFQFRVKISEGSTKGTDNLPELLDKLGALLIAKMSGKHAVITVLGLALIGSTAWGTAAYINGHKEVDLAKEATVIKIKELDTQQFLAKNISEQQAIILQTMKTQNELSARAIEAAFNIQHEYLRAASKTGTTVIGNTELTKEEAKDIIRKERGKPQVKIIEQNMRVVGGNTGSDYQTAVILEDPVTLQQYKISFSDPLISENSRRKVFAALEKRSIVWVKLSIREVDGEIRSAELIDFPRQPKDRKKRLIPKGH